MGTPFLFNTGLPVWCCIIHGWSRPFHRFYMNAFLFFVFLSLVFQKCGTITASLWPHFHPFRWGFPLLSLWLRFDPFRWGFIWLFLFPLGEPLHHQITAWGRLGLPVASKETHRSVQISELLTKICDLYVWYRVIDLWNVYRFDSLLL